MLRFTFFFIIFLHARIHLLGFASTFGLIPNGQLPGEAIFSLTTDAIRPLGLWWLLASTLLFLTSGLYLFKKEKWWMIGAVGLVVSQALIIVHWPEAKFGTLANLIIGLGIILAYGSWNFNTAVNQELEKFHDQVIPKRKIITQEMLFDLPPVVQQWLNRSQIIGKENIQSVHLQQRGQMRTTPNGKWMPVTADEYFTVAKPGFIWVADVKAAPLLHLAGRDKYENGRGHMLIKLLSLYPVANAKGKETDQGTLLRYLGEIVWFPTAALSNYIRWEQLSETAAKATMCYSGITATGIFRFNSAGDVISFEAKRYYDRKEGATLENWLVTVAPNSYREFGGIRVPTKSDVTWKLKTGDFTWFKLEVTDITFNQTIFNQAINQTGTLEPPIAKTNTYEMAR